MLGTAGYMAPEQIRGQPTDERADLFALGAILFELMTGRRAFDRDSRVETLNAVLHDDVPALGDAAANVPVALDRIVRRCLDKDPDARFQSARDLAFALDTVAELAAPTSTAVALPPVRRPLRWPALAATVLIVSAVVAFAIWRLQPSPVLATRQLARFALRPPPRLQFAGMPVISPDGTLAVYPAGEGPIDKQRLFFRHVDQLTTTALPGTEGAFMPFFSPDGRSVGFWAGNQLKTIRLDAAASPVVICAAGSFLGGAWAADGTIIFGSSDGLQQVGQDGGVPRPVTTANHLKSHIKDHRPSILPGGRALLISVRDGEAPFRIDVLTLATGARRTVVARGSHAEYSPTGHIVYAAGDALFGIPFDVDRLTVTGAPVKLLDGVDIPFALTEPEGSRSRRLAPWCFARNRRPRTERWCGPIVRVSPRKSRSSRGRSGHRACRRTAGNSPLSSMKMGVGISGSIVSTTRRFSRSPPRESTARRCGRGTGRVSPIFPSATAFDISCRNQATRARPPKACSRARTMISFLAAGRQMAVRSSTSTARAPRPLRAPRPADRRPTGHDVARHSCQRQSAGDLARRPLARFRHPAVRAIRAAGDLRTTVSRPRAVTSIRRCRRPASVEPGRREDLFSQQTRRAVGVFRRRDLRNAFRSFAWHRCRAGTAIVPESLCRRRVDGRCRLRRRA